MAVKRISDLSSILNIGIQGQEQRSITIEEGVVRDVIPQGVNSETQQLRKSVFEISWPTEQDETNPSRYNSKNLTYETLSAYMLHNVLAENYTFTGIKTINTTESKQGGLIVNGITNLNGTTEIDGDVLSVACTSVTISGEYTNIFGDKELNLSVIHDGSDSHIDIINKNRVMLSSDNLSAFGSTTSFVYDNSLTIYYRKLDKTLVPVLTFGHTGDTPTVKFNAANISNPIDGVINHSLWS